MIGAIVGSWGKLTAWRRRRVVTAGFERQVGLYQSILGPFLNNELDRNRRWVLSWDFDDALISDGLRASALSVVEQKDAANEALARQADVAADRLDSLRAARGQEFANGVNAIMNMQRKIGDLEGMAVAVEEQTQGIVAALRAERDGAEALARNAGRALRTLTFQARTSGGTAGPDAGLMAACDAAEAQLMRPELSALIDGKP